MPMHDWTRVSAGTYHDFHCSWLADLKARLNRGILPGDYYAQVEQVLEGMTADIVTLRKDSPSQESENGEAGGVAVAVAPPEVRFTTELEQDNYTALARHLVIRHSSDDRMIALLELMSPGNKSGEYVFRTFLDKAIATLQQGYHLLIIDPFPPTPRDPRGFHDAFWSEQGGAAYHPPEDKPLTLASYRAGLLKKAYVEPIAVGDPLTTMPLFLTVGRYIPVPLEESYQSTFQGVPRHWREVLERP